MLVNKSTRKEKTILKGTIKSTSMIKHYKLSINRNEAIYEYDILDSLDTSHKRSYVSSYLQSKYFQELIKRLGTK